MKRLLLLCPTRTYRAEAFVHAAGPVLDGDGPDAAPLAGEADLEDQVHVLGAILPDHERQHLDHHNIL